MRDMSKLKNGLKKVGLVVSTTVMSVAAGVTPAMAVDDFFENNEAAIKFIEKFAKLYQTWSLPFIVITAVAWAVTKDDKARAIEKRVLIGMIIAYILLSASRVVVESFTSFGTTILTTTGTPI